MERKQFEDISRKLDKICGLVALMAMQNIEKKDDKVFFLKKVNFTSEEISSLIGVKNPRQMEGWKRE